MADQPLPLPQSRGFGQTRRRDAWWVQPLAVLVLLGAFVIYSTFRVLQGGYYYYGAEGANYTQHANYLSPFYSPELWGESPHAWIGPKPGWWPEWLLFSPAALILWAPAGFRLTCYYYRGAYYKAFWADPPSCAVGEPRASYWGERWFPLILQNSHRFFLYLALLFLLVLGYDAWAAMWFQNADGSWSFGIGVGTIVLTLNVILLAGYTFGCHSLRHLIGGCRRTMGPVQRKCYETCTGFNRRHMQWAWLSLIWVALSDVYVYQLAIGNWVDYRLL